MPLPTLSLDPATLADLDADLDREWLVTNGLGGYAMGSVCGAPTRSYHGPLVAAVRPPVDRVVLVTNKYAGGVVDPRGFERLAGFVLEGLVPASPTTSATAPRWRSASGWPTATTSPSFTIATSRNQRTGQSPSPSRPTASTAITRASPVARTISASW